MKVWTVLPVVKLDERGCGHLERVEELTGAEPALGPSATAAR
jgi:hypothetical protein